MTPVTRTLGCAVVLVLIAVLPQRLGAQARSTQRDSTAVPIVLPPGRPVPSRDSTRSFAARFLAIAESRGREADSARLRRLFDLDWEHSNTEFPEFATFTGYPGQNARWTDASFAAERRRRTTRQAILTAVASIERERLAEPDRISHDLYRRLVEEEIEGERYPSNLLAVTQRDGPQYLSDVIAAMPTTDAAAYADILTRLDSVPRVVEQTIARLDSGLKVGVTPPRVTLREVPDQLERLFAADSTNPLFAPFRTFPTGMPEADRARLRARATEALRERAAPAYRRLHGYLTGTYIARARESIAASALPDGAAWYAFNVRTFTTTRLTPAEIHAIGLAEVRRLRAAMDSVMRAVEFSGSFGEFTTFLRTDRRFYHTDSAALVRAYRDVAKRADPELVRLFGRLPRLPYGVEAIPSFQAPSQTTAYYQIGSLDAGRPGKYFVNTYALHMRPTWEMEALTLHEAVPGHHLQLALAQELGELPKWRQYAPYTAFVEGWALYAESLGPELGLYDDPYSKFGQLTYEIWRAARLVLDTGIHSMGWTRQQAIDYFTANSAKTEQDIAVEVDRYIVWPGQALAYKVGELKLKELRTQAERELGPRFDVRAFHDHVLGAGALPLDVLDARVRAWVAAATQAGASTRR